jgi:hypothetical protein
MSESPAAEIELAVPTSENSCALSFPFTSAKRMAFSARIKYNGKRYKMKRLNVDMLGAFFKKNPSAS